MPTVTPPCPVPLTQPGWAGWALVVTHSPAHPGFVWTNWGPALGEGTAKRVGMATGLCRGAWALPSPPTVSLQPVSLEPSQGPGWRRLESHGDHFTASAAALTFPHPLFEWYGLQPAIQCLPASRLPGSGDEGDERPQPSSQVTGPGSSKPRLPSCVPGPLTFQT